MNITKLTQQLGIDEDEILRLIAELNQKYNLEIPQSGELITLHYNIIRSLLDHNYMIRMMLKSYPTKYVEAEAGPVESAVFNEWASRVNLSGFSSKEIGAKAAGGPYKNMQQVARMMRANGYESEVIYLGRDHQGRRWLKVGEDNTAGKKAAAERYERAYQAKQNTPSFL